MFVADGAGGARFVPLPAPTDDDVAEICARAARRILRLIDDDDDDDDDGTGALLADAARSPMGTLPFAPLPPPPPAKRRTAQVDDFTLHADTAVAAHDRDGLERLARYGARPPFAHRRLRLTASGQVAYRLRRPWFTGQTELVLAPVAFLRRLAALIPPPRQNQTRYHGVFAAHARLRADVTALVPDAPHRSAATPHPHHEPGADRAPSRPPSRPPSRLPWAELLRRVFREDLRVCPRCTGTMQVLATITDPAVVVAILTHLGAPTAPPAVAAARAPPQVPFWPGGCDPPADLDAYEPA